MLALLTKVILSIVVPGRIRAFDQGANNHRAFQDVAECPRCLQFTFGGQLIRLKHLVWRNLSLSIEKTSGKKYRNTTFKMHHNAGGQPF
jgi:hypothetical protein